LAAVLLPAEKARAEPPAREDGLFISIRNPITSDVVDNVKAKTKRALERTDRRIHTFIFDFNPGEQAEGHPSGTKEYGPCHDLAAYLLTLQEVKTVAFVHNEVTAHTVLPVLACTDIIMSSEAKLGSVSKDLPSRVLEDEVHFYEIVANRRGLCPAFVLKMLDRDVELLEATRLGAVW